MTVARNNKRLKRPVVSLFSGAMGLDLGLEAAGLEVAVALECSRFPVATIKRNRPELPLIDRPIEDVGSDEILERAGLTAGEPFAVVGGPSCQVFSTAGARKSLGDPRSTMFRHFVRVIRDIQPAFFVMENVRGLLSAAVRHRPLKERGPGHPPLADDEQLGSAFKVVAQTLRELGYYCVFDVLNAADFGVPQTRQRLVIIGSRDGKRLQMPRPTHHQDGGDGLSPWQTLGDALADLEEDQPEFYRFCPAKERYLRLVPEGGNWRDLPEQAKAAALGTAHDSWGGRSGFFRRLSRNRPSPALTTRPDSKATSLCHPTELRPLTVGEYARIQQFPDEWTFEGPVRKKYEQVGNAVPIGLGAALGSALISAARTHSRSERLGHFECHNLDLLAKLTRRPKTIVNPPRMRQDRPEDTITEWYGDGPRMRDDAFDYVPQEFREQFEGLVGRVAPPTTEHSSLAHDQDTAEKGAKGRRSSAGTVWLAAAE
ncbi:MAG: DNA cytosine methyltransferase [Inquilinaceae bacterium]